VSSAAQHSSSSSSIPLTSPKPAAATNANGKGSGVNGTNNKYGIVDESLAADAATAEALMTTRSFIMAMFRLVRSPFFLAAFFQLIYCVGQVCTHALHVPYCVDELMSLM
jgi:hypothetical protein